MQKVESNFFVSGQILPEEVSDLKKQGFESIICNRPNNEETGQPAFEDREKICKKNDINFHFIPISPGEIDPEKVFKLSSIIEDEKKTLAYCRTGNRSITQWAFANAKSLDIEEIISKCLDAGFDLNNLRDILQAIKG